MKRIDVSFSLKTEAVLRKMIGMEFQCYKCDPYERSSAAYGIIGIKIGNVGYEFSNYVEAADYFGKLEDVATFRLLQSAYDAIQSPYQESNMIETKVGKILSEIAVVNEKQSLLKGNVKIYEVNVTRGVIFKFRDGSEFSLEKDIWFSEDIIFWQGRNLIYKFEPVEKFYDSWSAPYRGECIRNMVIIK